jgi:DNA repair protein SbcC/Rad50
VLPIRLEVKNFLPYRTPDPIRFEGVHLACLTGGNGAGKSSLLDAITWVLWGRARAKRDEDLIHLGQTDMYVQLDFEQEGTIYRVIRRRTRRQRGSGTLDLLAQDEDGGFNLISEPSMRATQDRINLLLRLDYETFVNSAFLQQGQADAFTTKTPRERKQILSDILGLAQWEVYEEQVKAHLKQLESQLAVYALRIQEIDDELAREDGLKVALAEAEQAQAEARSALEGAEARLAEVAHVPRELQSQRDQRTAAQSRVRERERDVQAVAAEITRHQDRLVAFDTVIALREEIEAGYASLQAARAADHDLAAKLIQLTDFDAEQRQLENQLNAARAELENKASEHRATMAELERTQGQNTSDELAQAQADVAELQVLESERQTLQAELSALGEERADREATNRALRADMFALRDRLDQLQKAAGAVCPLCGQDLDEQHRQEILSQLSDEGTRLGDTYRGNETRVKDIGTEVSERQTRLTAIDTELKRLPPLIEQVGVLQAQADAASDAAARLQTERASLDAVQKLLDDEAFAQDVRAQLEQLAEQRAAIGYNRASHETARAQLDTYQAYEKRQHELDNALNSRPEIEELLDSARTRLEKTRAAVQEEHDRIATLEAEISRLEVLQAEFEARQQEVNALRTAERTAYQRLVNAQQELHALESQRIRKADLERRAAEARHEEGIYKELRLAFGKNGIPAMIIETAIPELETAANELLRRMTDGRMVLNFSTQREKKTGGVAETLDIQIADELGTRDYEMYSGGEAFRIDFAIRVALSQMLARRAGAHLRTLFVDEGFGTQDAAGRDRLVEAITAIQDDFDLILVITHIDELRDSFPVHVIVEKLPGGSRVSVR